MYYAPLRFFNRNFFAERVAYIRRNSYFCTCKTELKLFSTAKVAVFNETTIEYGTKQSRNY